MVQKSGVTLRDLLGLDCMKATHVVAGQKGLSRIVTNVNVMEVPDIIPWVNSGDLLLTTAYSIRHDPLAQANLIPQLASKGLAGLIMKPKRYLENIPKLMLQQADQMDFPLLELSSELSFSDIMHPILSEILHIQTNQFKKAEEAHRLFMEVILKGGRLEDIAATLSKLIDNTVILFDDAQNVLTKSLRGMSEDEFRSRLEQRGYVKAEAVDPLASGVKYMKSNLRLNPPLHEYQTTILARGKTCGYLTIWDNQRPLTQNDFIFIDRAMTVAALEILNERSFMEIERRYRNEFLYDVLRESHTDDKALIERARYLGWDLNQNYVAFVFDVRHTPLKDRPHEEHHLQKAKEQLFYHILSALHVEEKYIAGTQSDSIVLLLAPSKALQETKKARDYCCQRAEEILRSIEPRLKELTVSLGVGRFYPEISGLRRSYNEALKALTIGKHLYLESKIILFDQLGVYRLLEQLPDRDELLAFYQETIASLDAYDTASHADLVQTLSAFFECHGNLKQVSKQLYTHYNTIVYRMERIEEISGLNLKCPEARLNLQIGLKIRKILKEQRP